MAPRGRRGDDALPDALYTLGERGRKTGVFLPQSDVLDDVGMQPIEGIFSSPQTAVGAASLHDSGSEAMDIPSSAGPGPQTVLREPRNIQYPIPRSRSPLKTNLMSPARRNPHVGRTSSPLRGSENRDDGDDDDDDDESAVGRRLDFGGKSNGRQAAAKSKANGTNGVHRSQRMPAPSSDDGRASDLDEALDGSLQVLGNADDSIDLPREASDAEEEPVVKPTKARGRPRGRPKRSSQVMEPVEEPEPEAEAQHSDQEDHEPVKARGRPPKKQRAQPEPEPEPVQAPSRKRRAPRNSTGSEESAEEAELRDEPPEEPARPPKKSRTQGPATSKAPARTRPTPPPPSAKTPTSGKPRGRPKKAAKQVDAGEDDAGETSFVALQRGPPMPKARGLVSMRRDNGVTQTRSGRHSYKPLNWWRGDEVVRDVEEQGDLFYRDEFVVSSVKEVVRAPEEEAPMKRSSRGRSRSAAAKPKSRSKQRRAQQQDDEEPEDWELNEGNVMGEVVLWEPEHEQHPPADDEPVQITEDQIAISADAVQTTQIRDGTFRFAKTLTMPFMGSGIVDLPPGAEKRPKNSRKMHMVFFVHYGKVVVTVNEAQFRISAGGMWFVPRGNYYSISNDYDNPCRIFFAQACEVSPQAHQPDTPGHSHSMMDENSTLLR